MNNDDGQQLKAQLEAEWEARQSPIGFFNLAISYLDAADELTNRIHDTVSEGHLHLNFDSPVRHLYAHGWELALKACLFAQGVRPAKLKKDYGHKILRTWKAVDKDRFSRLDLSDDTEAVAAHLSYYHAEKLFAYPLTGLREYLPLAFLKAQSERFRIDRAEIFELFKPN